MFSSTIMRLALCASGTLQPYSFIIAAMSRSRWRACVGRCGVRLSLRHKACKPSKPGGEKGYKCVLAVVGGRGDTVEVESTGNNEVYQRSSSFSQAQ